MCEARVILRSDEGEKTVMEDAAALTASGDTVTIRNVLGDRVEVTARIERVDLLSNVVILRNWM